MVMGRRKSARSTRQDSSSPDRRPAWQRENLCHKPFSRKLVNSRLCPEGPAIDEATPRSGT